MRNLIAMVVSLAAVGAYAADVTWTGLDASNPTDWFAPDNWDGGAAPAAGDSVTIPSGVANMPVLSAPTPALASVSVAGTLTFTNWTTCLSATTVTIPSGGIVTCAGPFTDTEMSNRVWIACTDLTVASGGKVDVSDKGYNHSTASSGNNIEGFGPAHGYKKQTTYRPAAHGGWGSGENHFDYAQANVAYDSASEPILPGSGGYGNTSTAGGAVRIDASGTVSLSGDILADAADVGDTSTQYRTPGSGGSILINCDRVVGTSGARVSANGGGCLKKTFPKVEARFPGAGGRIAIHYSAATQEPGDLDGVFFSAAAGWDKGQGSEADRYPSARYRYIESLSSQNGTLWFTDEKAYGENLANLGTHFAGRLANVASLTVNGNLTVTNRLGFANEGVALTVTGNLSIEGNFGTFSFGETEVDSTRARKTACGTSPVTLTVGGDFILVDGARTDIYAGATNGLGAVGADVTVGGAFSVGANSTVYLYSHPANGGAPRISAASCTIADGALVSADTFGFESASSRTTDGLGPGGGTGVKKTPYASTAGSYGGLGGGAAEGKMYGSDIYPDLPGSAGATGYTMPTAGTLTAAGGGVVHIKTTGSVIVNGTISACGTLTGGAGNTTGGTFGGGSGGAILLEGKTFSGGATAVLSADGGSSTATYARGGGGGRVSVIVGDEYTSDVKPSRLVVEESLPAAVFSGTATVAGGTVGSAETGIAGGDGTIRFVTIKSGRGLTIFVQ